MLVGTIGGIKLSRSTWRAKGSRRCTICLWLDRAQAGLAEEFAPRLQDLRREMWGKGDRTSQASE
ncbi:hypothetical protein [Tychonema sp. LEGE 07203]|uniref:hypothetical protein n=1 Tax=Tychonema sp. LEGE 07203 TaxID=1828671 RepID=UPI0018813113|nr:hypothetical protein [Tychonema sp. LEGE 07203]MBE9093089.1 hypothetical protein [Tychonema sp. LEGE 07203]